MKLAFATLPWQMKNMRTSLDRFGRIVIPRRVREDLDLEPGAVFEVEERDEAILLQPLREAPDIKMKEGVLVFCGETGEDLLIAVRRAREERLQHLKRRAGGGSKRSPPRR